MRLYRGSILLLSRLYRLSRLVQRARRYGSDSRSGALPSGPVRGQPGRLEPVRRRSGAGRGGSRGGEGGGRGRSRWPLPGEGHESLTGGFLWVFIYFIPGAPRCLRGTSAGRARRRPAVSEGLLRARWGGGSGTRDGPPMDGAGHGPGAGWRCQVALRDFSSYCSSRVTLALV